MKLNNMRWGYDGGGFACGPVEGSTFVEAEVTDKDGQKYFVLMSRMAEFCKIEIARSPLFDLGMQGVEYERIREITVEAYDFERESTDPDDYDEDEEIPQGEEVYPCEGMYQSRFADAIKLTLKAMERCYEMQNPTDADAHLFAEEYLGKEIVF